MQDLTLPVPALMKNKIIVTDNTDPWRNLAMEELIMDSAEPNEMVLYLWQNRDTVVIGKNQNAWKECCCEKLEADGGRLARRSSGGGAVFHDMGNLNFTFAADPSRYDLERQLGVILTACRNCGIDAKFTGRNDITAEGRKFSGNAFRHTKKCSMQHGTLLVHTDPEKMSKYLNPEKVKLMAKGVTSVRSRIANLTEFNPRLTAAIMKQALMKVFTEEYGKAAYVDMTDFASDELDILYSKYSSWEWRYGLLSSFEAELHTRFGWGDVQILLNHKDGIIDSVKVYTDSMETSLASDLENILTGRAYGKPMHDAVLEKSYGNSQLSDVADFLKKCF